jgi:hypothetical protein
MAMPPESTIWYSAMIERQILRPGPPRGAGGSGVVDNAPSIDCPRSVCLAPHINTLLDSQLKDAAKTHLAGASARVDYACCVVAFPHGL